MKKLLTSVCIVALIITMTGCSEKMFNSMVEKGLEQAISVNESDVHIYHGDTKHVDKSLKDIELLRSLKVNDDAFFSDYILKAEKRLAIVGTVEKVTIYKKGNSIRIEREEEDETTTRIYNEQLDKTYYWDAQIKTGSVYSGKSGDFSFDSEFTVDRETLKEDHGITGDTDIAKANFENVMDTLKAGGITNHAEIVNRFGGDVLKVSMQGTEESGDLSGELNMYMSINYVFPIEVSAVVNGATVFTHIVTEFKVNPTLDDALFEKPADVRFYE